MRLENKVAVVTGASSGLGYEIVRTFTREGAHVVAVARRIELLQKLQDELKEHPGNLVIMQGDVSLKETNEKMIDLAIEKFGRLDILVNNAGIMDDFSGVADVDEERFDKIMKLNVNAPLYAMKKAVKVMKAQGGGSIINMASVGGMRSVAGIAYTTSKAAVISMTRNTAFMYQPYNIRCNAIAPGGIRTEITNSMGGAPNPEGWERASKLIAASSGMGEPADIANAALYLASDEAKFVSGITLIVDGGWLAG